MPANTVFRYIGDEVAGTVNLSIASQNYRDPTKWAVTSEPWGYIDFANNRISVHNSDNEANNWVVVAEDTADYSARRGAYSIGGLDSGKTYVIIALEDDPTTAVDESHYVQLALTEQNAIDGKAIDLTTGGATPAPTPTTNDQHVLVEVALCVPVLHGNVVDHVHHLRQQSRRGMVNRAPSMCVA